MPSFRGFILQPTYRVESGAPSCTSSGGSRTGARSSCATGGSSRASTSRDDDADARGRGEPGARRPPTRSRSLGRPVVRVEVNEPADAPPLRDRLARAGIPTYEADVRFAMRHLIDRGIRGSLEIHGEGRETAGLGLVFEDPEILPADWTPAALASSPSTSRPIPQARRLLADRAPRLRRLRGAAPHASGPRLSGRGARRSPTEKELLAAFCARVRELDPDVLTGWNVVDFDLAVLDRLARAARRAARARPGPGDAAPARLGPAPRGAPGDRSPAASSSTGSTSCAAPSSGWTTTASTRWPARSWARARPSPGTDRAEEILRLFEEDRERFVEYNRTDARLVLEILERLRLVELAVERSRLTGLPLDRVASSIAAFDFLYLSELGRRGIVAPSVARRAPRSESRRAEATSSSPAPGSTRTSSSSTSRASTRASSAPSRSTP